MCEPGEIVDGWMCLGTAGDSGRLVFEQAAVDEDGFKTTILIAALLIAVGVGAFGLAVWGSDSPWLGDE